jgi:hypothetical protein
MLKDDPAVRETGRVPTDPAAPLILDFLEWLAPAPRPYAEVMEAWRTSCPRLTIWEDAVDGGYVVRKRADERHVVVELTPRGQQLLSEAGR